MNIEVKVKNKIATQTNDTKIVCGNKDYVVNFDFDEEWENHDVKTARFVFSEGSESYVDVVFTGSSCVAPQINNSLSVKIGVYAGDLRTTTPAYIDCVKSILSGDPTHIDPPEDVYNQIIELLSNLSTQDAFYANGADYGEVGTWSDGNPNKENRLYRFVTVVGDGREIAIADSNDQIAGVTTDKAGFVGNAKDYDKNDTTKNIIGIIGVVPVRTNDNTIKANDRVMSDDNGYAVKSSNNLGYRVLSVLEEGLLEIVVSVNTDMIQRIKTQIGNLSELQTTDNESLVKAINEVKQSGYKPPEGGIPKTDLSEDVQSSLDKAETALQEAPVTSVNGQTGEVTGLATTDYVDNAAKEIKETAEVAISDLKDYVDEQFDEQDLLIDSKQDKINDLDTIREGAKKGETALQSFTEQDPTVPAWAKTSTKPTYTANEVGAYSKEEVDTKTTEIDDKLDLQVETKSDDSIIIYDGDTVKLHHYYKNIKTGATSEKEETLAELATTQDIEDLF